jgi:hypothetical protein
MAVCIYRGWNRLLFRKKKHKHIDLSKTTAFSMSHLAPPVNQPHHRKIVTKERRKKERKNAQAQAPVRLKSLYRCVTAAGTDRPANGLL